MPRSREKRVLLLVPPLLQPSAPFQATAALTAHLRASGLDVEQRDLNVEFFLWLNRPENAAAFARLCRKHGLLTEKGASEVRESLRAFPVVYDALRDRSTFLDGPRLARLYRHYCELLPGLISPAEGAAISRRGVAFWKELFTGFFVGSLDLKDVSVVGLSCAYHTQLEPLVGLAGALRSTGFTGWILGGGSQFSRLAWGKERLPGLCPPLSGLVLYEGEHTLEKLCRDPSRPELVPNLLYHRNGRLVQNAFEAAPKSLNALPTPDFGGLPLSDYCLPDVMFPLTATRGCYWSKCVFCVHSFYTTNGDVKFRNADRVVGDIERLHERHGMTHFRFTDDSLPAALLDRIVAGLLDRRLPVRWVTHLNVMPEFTDARRLRRMYDAGCRLANFGLESASPRVRALMRKDPPGWDGVRLLREILPRFRDAGLQTGLTTMTGFPTETSAEALGTLRFIERHIREISFVGHNHPFRLHDPSAVFREAVRFGIRLVPGHPRGYVPRRGMSHGTADRVAARIRRALTELERRHAHFFADSAVFPHAFLRACYRKDLTASNSPKPIPA